MQVVRAFVLIVLAGSATVGTFERDLDHRALETAQALARTPVDATRQRFHTAYRVQVNEPPVDYVEVITPYRRVVLEAEAAVRAGRIVGQRDALDALGDAPTRVDIVVELTFHPLNTYVGMPGYEVRLVRLDEDGDEEIVEPLTLARVPRHGPRLGDPDISVPLPVQPTAPRVPDASEPMLGGSLIAAFDGDVLDERGVYDLVVMEGEAEIARARVDLAGFR